MPFGTTCSALNMPGPANGQPVNTPMVGRRPALTLWRPSVLTIGGGILAASSRNAAYEALLADTAIPARGGK
ncbi:MAG: hypothetical protein ING12_03375 [Roseomonas sp.]|nr:hypothetical protein [Roseomonas sp.]